MMAQQTKYTEYPKDYAQEEGRINLIRNERNLGLTTSLDKGTEKASGKYIARIDAGDSKI
jgi:glycosyltransferase involved in cell wall biosynthesis